MAERKFTLTGVAEHKDTSTASAANGSQKSGQSTKSSKGETLPRKPKREESANEDSEDDILSGVQPKRKNSSTVLLVALIAVIAVVGGVVVYTSFMHQPVSTQPEQSTQSPQSPESPESPESPSTEQQPSQSPSTEQQPSQQSPLGTQDFTKDTNMTTSSTLDDVDEFVQDVTGLTTRVDYTVKNISYITDLVSYTKKRGTFGNGLELYWLAAEYQGTSYSIQVPFKYYKELKDSGIVPVKVEVLSIQDSTSDRTLNVVSYMTLDESTLSTILKEQAKVGN